MSFSNGGVDTFDQTKAYIGIRLQQGVPLLDRDWNELEDIRRHVERVLREYFIGDGVPDLTGFAVSAPGFPAAADVLIAGGRCTVAGYDLWNQQDPVLYSEQGDRVTLPPADPNAADVLSVYLEPDVVRVDSTADPALANAQDINIETCLRDQLQWAVRAVRKPAVPPVDGFLLAEIHRPAGTGQITADMIIDQRRVQLNLARPRPSSPRWSLR